MHALTKFIRDEEGLTAIEYVIGASLLVAGLTLLFTGFGAKLAEKLNTIIASIGTTPAAP